MPDESRVPQEIKQTKLAGRFCMSREMVRKFYEVLKSDAVTAGEFRDQLESAAPERMEIAAALAVKFAAGKGYVFTAEELLAFDGEAFELSREELEKINAAGAGKEKPVFLFGLPWI